MTDSRQLARDVLAAAREVYAEKLPERLALLAAVERMLSGETADAVAARAGLRSATLRRLIESADPVVETLGLDVALLALPEREQRVRTILAQLTLGPKVRTEPLRTWSVDSCSARPSALAAEIDADAASRRQTPRAVTAPVAVRTTAPASGRRSRDPASPRHPVLDSQPRNAREVTRVARHQGDTQRQGVSRDQGVELADRKTPA